MTRVVIIILGLIVCTTVKAQSITPSENSYRVNDELQTKRVYADGVDMQTDGGVWSLETAVLSEKPYVTLYAMKGDSLMKLERGSRTYYRQSGERISIIGSENVQTLLSYDMPETWLKFPMQLGDSIGGFFSGTGKYCDRLFVRRFGSYKTKADAVGKIVLPEGDTLRNVMRLRTERYISTLTAPVDTLAKGIPTFTVDSIVKNMALDTTQIQECVYRWYAEGYRYPVLEARTVSSHDTLYKKEMYYCPLEVQEQLVLDEENRSVRTRRTSLAEADGLNTSDSLPDMSGGAPFQIRQDEYAKTLSVEFATQPSARVTAMLANSQGYVYRRTEQIVNGAMTISYSGLPHGQYVVYVNTPEQQFTRKFSLR